MPRAHARVLDLVILVIVLVLIVLVIDLVVLNLIVVWMSLCRLEGLMAQRLDGSTSS